MIIVYMSSKVTRSKGTKFLTKGTTSGGTKGTTSGGTKGKKTTVTKGSISKVSKPKTEKKPRKAAIRRSVALVAASAPAVSAQAVSAPAVSAQAVSAQAVSAQAASELPIHYYVHNTHIRPLIVVPINNPDLWPMPAAPFFRSTGTSNEGYGMFAGTWFPFISMKDSAKMPGYLTIRQTGFIIKSGFIYGENDEVSLSPNQKWIHELVEDYPVELNESIIAFLHIKGKEPVKFIDLYNRLVSREQRSSSGKIDTTSPIYFELLQLLENTMEYVFCRFLKYFLYPWQVMVSRNLGGGYWDLNRDLYNYIGEKLSIYNTINTVTPIVDDNCSTKDTETSCAIKFLEDHDAQMSLTQIRELEIKERPSINMDNMSSATVFFVNGKIEIYYNRIKQLINVYESAKRAMALLKTSTLSKKK